MHEYPSFPCGKHEQYYIDQCEAWLDEHVDFSQFQGGLYDDTWDAKNNPEYYEFTYNLQSQLMNVTGYINCPISCRCEHCLLGDEEDVLAEDEDQDILEEEEEDVLESRSIECEADLTDCERFIMECEDEYR